MPLLSAGEVLRLKLSTIPVGLLRDFARRKSVSGQKGPDIIKNMVETGVSAEEVDGFIRSEYLKAIESRQANVPDDKLLAELNKVDDFTWGVVQGQLDNKIQVGYVRKYWRYSELLEEVAKDLYDSVKKYVVCTWYNHWTTVLLEDLISSDRNVVPTLKNVKGVDLFFGGQPFDLKITYMPRRYPNPETVSARPGDLAVWLYENQGAQRFGADNRLFVVVHDAAHPEESWKIKREVAFIEERIRSFFATESVSERDELVFTFQKQTYTAISKVLLILK